MARSNKIKIFLGIIAICTCMLTVTFVMASSKNKEAIHPNYYLGKVADDRYSSKDLVFKSTIKKEVTNNNRVKNYQLKVQNGNVYLINTSNGSKKVVYSKGNAKYLTEVNLYYYDTAYALIITDSGELYANIYRSNEENIMFRKIKTKTRINKLVALEYTFSSFKLYPRVQLYNVDPFGGRELIKL